MAAVSFKVEVTTSGDKGVYSSNALRFATREAAEKYGANLFMRWTAVKEWRVVESADAVTEAS